MRPSFTVVGWLVVGNFIILGSTFPLSSNPVQKSSSSAVASLPDSAALSPAEERRRRNIFLEITDPSVISSYFGPSSRMLNPFLDSDKTMLESYYNNPPNFGRLRYTDADRPIEGSKFLGDSPPPSAGKDQSQLLNTVGTLGGLGVLNEILPIHASRLTSEDIHINKDGKPQEPPAIVSLSRYSWGAGAGGEQNTATISPLSSPTEPLPKPANEEMGSGQHDQSEPNADDPVASFVGKVIADASVDAMLQPKDDVVSKLVTSALVDTLLNGELDVSKSDKTLYDLHQTTSTATPPPPAGNDDISTQIVPSAVTESTVDDKNTEVSKGAESIKEETTTVAVTEATPDTTTIEPATTSKKEESVEKVVQTTTKPEQTLSTSVEKKEDDKPKSEEIKKPTPAPEQKNSPSQDDDTSLKSKGKKASQKLTNPQFDYLDSGPNAPLVHAEDMDMDEAPLLPQEAEELITAEKAAKKKDHLLDPKFDYLDSGPSPPLIHPDDFLEDLDFDDQGDNGAGEEISDESGDSEEGDDNGHAHSAGRSVTHESKYAPGEVVAMPPGYETHNPTGPDYEYLDDVISGPLIPGEKHKAKNEGRSLHRSSKSKSKSASKYRKDEIVAMPPGYATHDPTGPDYEYHDDVGVSGPLIPGKNKNSGRSMQWSDSNTKEGSKYKKDEVIAMPPGYATHNPTGPDYEYHDDVGVSGPLVTAPASKKKAKNEGRSLHKSGKSDVSKYKKDEVIAMPPGYATHNPTGPDYEYHDDVGVSGPLITGKAKSSGRSMHRASSGKGEVTKYGKDEVIAVPPGYSTHNPSGPDYEYHDDVGVSGPLQPASKHAKGSGRSMHKSGSDKVDATKYKKDDVIAMPPGYPTHNPTGPDYEYHDDVGVSGPLKPASKHAKGSGRSMHKSSNDKVETTKYKKDEVIAMPPGYPTHNPTGADYAYHDDVGVSGPLIPSTNFAQDSSSAPSSPNKDTPTKYRAGEIVAVPPNYPTHIPSGPEYFYLTDFDVSGPLIAGPQSEELEAPSSLKSGRTITSTQFVMTSAEEVGTLVTSTQFSGEDANPAPIPIHDIPLPDFDYEEDYESTESEPSAGVGPNKLAGEPKHIVEVSDEVSSGSEESYYYSSGSASSEDDSDSDSASSSSEESSSSSSSEFSDSLETEESEEETSSKRKYAPGSASDSEGQSKWRYASADNIDNV